MPPLAYIQSNQSGILNQADFNPARAVNSTRLFEKRRKSWVIFILVKGKFLFRLGSVFCETHQGILFMFWSLFVPRANVTCDVCFFLYRKKVRMRSFSRIRHHEPKRCVTISLTCLTAPSNNWMNSWSTMVPNGIILARVTCLKDINNFEEVLIRYALIISQVHVRTDSTAEGLSYRYTEWKQSLFPS